MIEKQAPQGKFRVIGANRGEGSTKHQIVGDYSSLEEALMVAHKSGAMMNPVSVHSDDGKIVFSAGSYKVAQ